MPYNPGAAGSSYPYWYYYPYGAEQWLEEDRPAYITKSQWASHGETLKGTLDAAHANGGKIDETKTSLAGALAGGIKDTHDAIKDTQAAVKGVHDTLKEAYGAIQKNHGECCNKQDGCASEIEKVRKHLEDEAKRREEAYHRQQDVWYYSQFLRQEERDAEASSTRSSKSSKSSGSDKPHRRHARPEDPYEAERRRFHAFAQAYPPWAGLDPWQQPFPPYPPPGREDLRHGHAAAAADGPGQRGPPRPPFYPLRHHRRFA